jgi:biotin operon repressor/anti-sigma regulatory factor (Ser/Thr protein kinase)
LSDIWNLVLERVRLRGYVTSAEICEATGLSRQAVNVHLRRLREQGRLRKVGRTRGVKYVLPDGDSHPGASLERVLPNLNLEEDRVFSRIERELNLESALVQNAREILRYSFTEMLNNAIEHSESEHVRVRMESGAFDASFVVKDYGIGIYERIRRERGLESEAAALTDLLKGKTTTAPDRHTGEGVFFTSKCADRMSIESHRLALRFDNRKGRTLTERIRHQDGTRVEFAISRRSRRVLKEVFDAYGGEEFDYAFSKTSVEVRLSGSGGGPVARSEARRLLAGLDRFRVVRLDFRGVDRLGQAFADEVFRVFADRHPGIRIEPENMNEAVRAMVDHVRGS